MATTETIRHIHSGQEVVNVEPKTVLKKAGFVDMTQAPGRIVFYSATEWEPVVDSEMTTIQVPTSQWNRLGLDDEGIVFIHKQPLRYQKVTV